MKYCWRAVSMPCRRQKRGRTSICSRSSRRSARASMRHWKASPSRCTATDACCTASRATCCGALTASLDPARRLAYSSAAMAGHILMIEDDERLAAMVSDYLGEVGFRVNHHANAEDGLAALKRVRFDALILDVMLPDVDGFEVCRRVRATSDIPILMLTARGEATDRVVGLELGADDYLSNPFNPHELLARLKAILRRSQAAHSRESVLRFGRLEI